LSPVFRHGSLRLYLLRLLDEEPRHGYEVIRLLRDRFMGVYSPSPGTIYPRLARLEEEGLVTHDEENGRKVYRITEAGREELRKRSTELDELEAELSASVNDIVRDDAKQMLYVATDFGVLRGDGDGTGGWHVTKGLPRFEITHLEIQPSARVPTCVGLGGKACPTLIYAATHSQGIWKLPLGGP